MRSRNDRVRALCLLAITLSLAVGHGCAAGGGGAGARRAPDLVVTDVSGTPTASIPSGQRSPYKVSFEIENQGGRFGTPFRVGLYLSLDADIDPVADTLVDSTIVSSMEADEILQSEFTGDFPPLWPGLYRIGIYADDDPSPVDPGSVVEKNETNNSKLDPQPLDVIFATPPAPSMFVGEDTAFWLSGQWVTEGAIRLMWETVPEADGYNIYRSTLPIGPGNPGVPVNPTVVTGPSLAAGFNIHAYIDGTSQVDEWAAQIPTNGAPNLPQGVYYYRVLSVDGIGQESASGPDVVAQHSQAGTVPADILNGSPGLPPPMSELISTLTPTFNWIAVSAPDQWAIAVGEPSMGVNPTWIYFGFGQGQTSVMIDYGTVGDFTIKGAAPLLNNTVYDWIVAGYDANGWGVLRGRRLSILTPP